MHWFFAKKKEKEIEIKPIPGPVHRPRSRYTRRTTPRPAPKTKPRPRPMTRKAIPIGTMNQVRTQFKTQLNRMKQSTNKLRQANENRHDLLRFMRNGIPKPRPQPKNKSNLI